MNHDKTKGFTIIELMLAMTFIAVLLMAVAMTTIQISNIYTKGITLREVNQAGRTLTDEFQRSIASSVPFDVTPRIDNSPATAASKYVKWDGGGRLCLGSYSYAWNYGRALAGGTGAPPVLNKYATGSAAIRFVKVLDPNGGLCANLDSPIDASKASEILSSGDRDLVLHNFKIAKTESDASFGQSLYAISFLVGTNDREQLAANDASCKPPAEGVGGEDYCSVNQFEIVARAGNTAGGN